MTLSHSTYTGYGGGGGSGGVYWHEAATVNYDDSMTINIDGGARGNGYDSDDPSYRAGFAGSDGKVFLVSRLLFFFSYLIDVRCLSNNHLIDTYIMS